MLTDAEQEERTLLYGRVYGPGARPDDALVRRLRELEERALTPPARPEPAAETGRSPDTEAGSAPPAATPVPNGGSGGQEIDGPPDENPEARPTWRRRLALNDPRRTAVLPVIAAVAGLVGGALLGATFTPPTAGGDIPELSYAATGEDRLPFPDDAGLLDPASVRFIASTDNGLIYVGRQRDVPDEVCLAVVFSSVADAATAQCGAFDVTAQVDPNTWVVIGEPSSAKMNNTLPSRFDTRQLSESVRLYELRDRS